MKIPRLDYSGSIDDLRTLPQDPRAYIKDQPSEGIEDDYKTVDSFVDLFFSPWRDDFKCHLSREWGINVLKNPLWGSNLMPVGEDLIDRFLIEAQMDSFPSMDMKGIITSHTSGRFLPDHAPMFHDPEDPGEGYPFDVLQNTSYWAGTPVKIYHSNRRGDWLLCSSAAISGWVPARDVAFVDEAFQRVYRDKDLLCSFCRDDDSIVKKGGGFLLKSHIGMVLPFEKDSDGFMEIKVPIRNLDGFARVEAGHIDPAGIVDIARPFSPSDMADIAFKMISDPYGWGGLYEGRDCSSTMKDLYVSFGIWLPRDSGPQSRLPGYIDLEGLTSEEKILAIEERALPFRTIIGMAGHVVLYLGKYNGVHSVLHNLWGVRLKDGGRLILGRNMVTSLRPGAERDDVDPDWFLDRVKSLSFVI